MMENWAIKIWVAQRSGSGTYPSFVGPIDVGSIHGVADGILQITLFVVHRPDNSVWRWRLRMI